MLAVEDTVLVLLAAGRSARFGGSASKLEQPLCGLPLGLHVAAALAGMPWRARLAVIAPDCRLDYAQHGYTTAINPDRDSGMGSSLRRGVVEAMRYDPVAVVIALADMPCVTAAHVHRLFAAAGDEVAVVASSDGDSSLPPALFGRAHFDALTRASGDRGARDLIRSGQLVGTDAGELTDVDTPADLARLRAFTRGAARRSG